MSYGHSPQAPARGAAPAQPVTVGVLFSPAMDSLPVDFRRFVELNATLSRCLAFSREVCE